MGKVILQSPNVLKLIAHDIRWALVRELARSDYKVQELIERLGLPQNLVSYHLRKLREGQVVSERRSNADEREIYYRLDLDQLQSRYLAAGSLIHPAIAPGIEHTPAQEAPTHRPAMRVLFLCTENSARSQMAEALLRHESRGTVEAYSAGSQPAAQMHPLARHVMEQIGIDMRQARPKPLSLFEGQHFDAIITVCDRIREVCPTFPDDPEQIHWSLLDPASVPGNAEEQRHAFEQTAQQLTTRIRALLPLLMQKKESLCE